MKIIVIVLFLNITSAFAFDWSETQDTINNAIKERTLPGAVLLIGNKKEVLLHQAFGSRDANSIENTTSSLYDIASLTKIIATTTSIMILEESSRLSLQDKVNKFFPEFSGGEKSNITIEQVLRHEAGFPPGQSPQSSENFDTYFQRFLRAPLNYSPGSKFMYSDLSFILLAQVVQKITSQTIEEFATNNIFIPLEMTSTYYHVPNEFISLCAPTIKSRAKCLPHDPTAYRFSPIELGHAGLFSTAENLSHLVSMYLNMGQYKGQQFLKEETVKKMITLPNDKIRGLGFDLLSPYADAPRGKVFPKGISYGHTGYTGTTIWIDPSSESYLIFLSNRVLLGDEATSKNFIKLRSDISTAIGKQFYPNL